MRFSGPIAILSRRESRNERIQKLKRDIDAGQYATEMRTTHCNDYLQVAGSCPSATGAPAFNTKMPGGVLALLLAAGAAASGRCSRAGRSSSRAALHCEGNTAWFTMSAGGQGSPCPPSLHAVYVPQSFPSSIAVNASALECLLLHPRRPCVACPAPYIAEG